MLKQLRYFYQFAIEKGLKMRKFMQMIASDVGYSESEWSRELLKVYKRFMASIAPIPIQRVNVALAFQSRRYPESKGHVIFDRWVADEFKQLNR